MVPKWKNLLAAIHYYERGANKQRLHGEHEHNHERTIDTQSGMPVLLHVKIGRLEPASIKFNEDTGELVIKTDR